MNPVVKWQHAAHVMPDAFVQRDAAAVDGDVLDVQRDVGGVVEGCEAEEQITVESEAIFAVAFFQIWS